MQLQHVNVKVLLQNSGETDLERLVPVFHSWIQDKVVEGLLLDVADYLHVDGGPGVVLIGHEGNYSVDNTDHRLGVRYNRKAVLDGNNQDRLKQAARAALIACQRLEGDARLEGGIRFNGREIEVLINDRLLAPNSAATREALDRDLHAFSKTLFGGKEYALSYDDDPRKLFAVTVKAAQPLPVAELLESLA